MINQEIKEIIKNFFKWLGIVIFQYMRTIAVSFLVALVFTLFLTAHAKNEMIRKFYANVKEQSLLEEKIAKQLVENSDLLETLSNKPISVCIRVGDLYYKAQDYKNAEFAYRYAVKKNESGKKLPYFKLANALIAQGKFEEPEAILHSITEERNVTAIKQKTILYMNMGDKYYSVGKFLSAAKCYEKADFYYKRFNKSDKKVKKQIHDRIVNSYVNVADTMVKSGLEKDAILFLKKAEKLVPDDYIIKYKLAILYSDIDPEKAVEYFEPLLEKIPQEIDFGTYCKALMKSANIADLQGNSILAKRYRYKIHSADLLIERKVVYRNDIDVILDSFDVSKKFFRYRLRPKYRFENVSNTSIKKMNALFVLRKGERELERVEKVIVSKNPLESNGGVSDAFQVTFGKNIFTKRELSQYEIDIYLYKDAKYKTLVNTIKVPTKNVHSMLDLNKIKDEIF